MVEDGFGLLLVHQTKGEMGGHVAHGERQERLLSHAMIDAVLVGVHDVVRQGSLRDPIRLPARQLPAPELEADQGARWNRLASEIRSPVSVLNGSVSRASLMASRISSSHPSGVRGSDRFMVESASPFQSAVQDRRAYSTSPTLMNCEDSPCFSMFLLRARRTSDSLALHNFISSACDASQ